ncbi:uncharacterized protein B0H18DRAFT_320461 [Fomitopsis serialis]|uniref:uncharacterized protein n=1 Tax=Fomitopsis serialis TaxID=139415 RepID=UPI00200878A5|nr:uncharacterized protein B0H18DRAFT_320461 [Neoantrodia serialis]KAH9936332.1 hypothetical protein B0H18DRAFT_320461 [Neoantrodia serialis]
MCTVPSSATRNADGTSSEAWRRPGSRVYIIIRQGASAAFRYWPSQVRVSCASVATTVQREDAKFIYCYSWKENVCRSSPRKKTLQSIPANTMETRDLRFCEYVLLLYVATFEERQGDCLVVKIKEHRASVRLPCTCCHGLRNVRLHGHPRMCDKKRYFTSSSHVSGLVCMLREVALLTRTVGSMSPAMPEKQPSTHISC